MKILIKIHLPDKLATEVTHGKKFHSFPFLLEGKIFGKILPKEIVNFPPSEG